MILTTTSAQALETRQDVTFLDYQFGLRTYLVDAGGRPGSPQAHLVEQPPGSVVRPHFHEVDQFQVVVRGGGRLGRHQVTAVTLHYADAYTGYGPIHADDEGLWYFTLRASHDPGARYLPESLGDQRKAPRRYRIAPRVHLRHPDVVTDVERTEQETVLPTEHDGLAAWLLRLGPNARTSFADPADGGGQYILVLAGIAEHEGRRFDRWSCLFLSSEETPASLTAGAEGAEVLVLQFPRGISR